MNETVFATISCQTLSHLLYENANSNNEQEGFLIGDTSVIVTKTISDSDSDVEKRQTVVNIIEVCPCPSTGLFYNSVGAVDKKKLEAILGEKMKKIVGWFYYEPQFQFKLSARKKTIHRELCKHFRGAVEQFAWCLLSSNNSPNTSTLLFPHRFVRYHRKSFITLPIQIDNLGESVDKYKPSVRATLTFRDLCKSLKLRTPDLDWNSIDKIQDKLQIGISCTMKKLSKSEEEKSPLERELQEIMQKIEEQQCIRENKRLAEAQRKVEQDAKLAESNLNSILDTFYVTKNPEKTDEVVDNKSNSSMEECETNVIDLTVTDEEEAPKKMSYSEITLLAVAKK